MSWTVSRLGWEQLPALGISQIERTRRVREPPLRVQGCVACAARHHDPLALLATSHGVKLDAELGSNIYAAALDARRELLSQPSKLLLPITHAPA